ncbi:MULTISPECIES: GNAT family N-acetyltransferase [unclassified Rathayibacter]|uniref:GNAT family N-acetyltransferase n=1 Tax=unclassified Rathayibacter TaxID=2609250 RepID=UPI000CE7DC6C|nr:MULTISPECIES: GNAT family N-acetyltransferase [unclassified Rathayibacter]PPG14506.1 GNAT family N-acetyltransferase [Rathayibacter sp. AY1C6]PPH06728.1 GNAT family N-acetyltransferase [Rathayibacter sp. AY1H3]PPI42157.1 GNAT family N-acetyltransferase [Rathayibacter sp. RFBD1]PPI63891.1 GNAT family N-acetyltransferase [Rathayibacter sp. TRS19]
MIADLTLPCDAGPGERSLLLRRAVLDDLPAIVRLLSDDPISAGRGDVAAEEDGAAYEAAFRSIAQDPGNDLVVAVDGAGAVVGTLQLTVIPGMARRGSSRLLIEAVRVASAERSAGIGTALMRWVLDVAAIELRTPLVQLTSDAARTDAHRFYLRLGFVDSHVGFKRRVELPGS